MKMFKLFESKYPIIKFLFILRSKWLWNATIQIKTHILMPFN